MYDVLHDSEYRREWDSNVIDTHDIAQVAVNADVGYYACECRGPRGGVVLAFFCQSLGLCSARDPHTQPGRRDVIWGAGCGSALLLCEVGC